MSRMSGGADGVPNDARKDDSPSGGEERTTSAQGVRLMAGVARPGRHCATDAVDLPMAEPGRQRLRVVAAGDIALPPGPETERITVRPSIRALMKSADLVIGNLESPCVGGNPALGKVNLQMEDRWVGWLSSDMGIGAVSLANNHILDYGTRGAERTATLLQAAGIRSFGLSEGGAPQTPLQLTIRGEQIGFLGYVAPSVGALLSSRGVGIGPAPLDPRTACSEVQELKMQCRFVVVSLHWGVEHQFFPSPLQIRLAHRLIDAGADVIVGHHAHVVQGYEQYRDGLVFYGLGNLLFPDYEVPSFFDASGTEGRHRGSWAKWNRVSLVPMVELPEAPGASPPQAVPHFAEFDAQSGRLAAVGGERERRLLRRLATLSCPLTVPAYRVLWETQARFEQLRVVLRAIRNQRSRHRAVRAGRDLQDVLRRVLLGRSSEGEGV